MSGLAHCIHALITIFVFWPWLIVWVLCAALSSSKPKQDTLIELQKENNALLKKLNEKK